MAVEDSACGGVEETMVRYLAIFGLLTMCRPAAPRSVDDIERWVEAQGGFVVRDSGGSIVEVSLGGASVTDGDLDRLVEIKSLRKLDLGLTYVTDRGIQRLRSLDN